MSKESVNTQCHPIQDTKLTMPAMGKGRATITPPDSRPPDVIGDDRNSRHEQHRRSEQPGFSYVLSNHALTAALC